MNGPEHYRAAEERLRASDWQRQQDGATPEAMHEAAMAQVHATLALVAATVEQAANAAIAADINSLVLDAWYPLTHMPTKDGASGE
ncbi:hypothetical protein ACWF94_03540 [Streptomyces sp. NPDC055078]